MAEISVRENGAEKGESALIVAARHDGNKVGGILLWLLDFEGDMCARHLRHYGESGGSSGDELAMRKHGGTLRAPVETCKENLILF